MEFDLIIDTIELNNGWFKMKVFEARTNRLLYQSPALDAGNCALAILHTYELAQANGHHVQVRICEGLATVAREIVAKLN